MQRFSMALARSRKAHVEDDEGTSFADRLIAAVLATLVAAGGLVAAWVLLSRGYFPTRWLGASAWSFLHAALWFIAIAAALGFVLGTNGLATFVGHVFMTNDGE